MLLEHAHTPPDHTHMQLDLAQIQLGHALMPLDHAHMPLRYVCMYVFHILGHNLCMDRMAYNIGNWSVIVSKNKTKQKQEKVKK